MNEVGDLQDLGDDAAYLQQEDTVPQRIAGWLGLAVICGFVAERILRHGGWL